jgi:cell division transport system permease protein
MIYFNFTKRNIRRTPYQAIAASMVMFLTFLTLIISSLLILGSQQILKYYESKPQAIAFFKDNTPSSDIEAIKTSLNQTGKVTSLKYVSKEEALKIYQERNKNTPVLLELVTANILPASLEISTTTPEDLSTIGDILKKEPVVEDVVVPEDAIAGLTRATTVIRWVGGLTAGFLVVFSFFLLLMVIGFKIRLRRSEIEIEKLLGASTWFIRTPFIMEGMVYGAAGAFMAWVLSYIILWYFTPYLQNYLEGIPPDAISLPVSPIFMLMVLLLSLALSITIGALGSFGAVRRYLHL